MDRFCEKKFNPWSQHKCNCVSHIQCSTYWCSETGQWAISCELIYAACTWDALAMLYENRAAGFIMTNHLVESSRPAHLRILRQAVISWFYSWISYRPFSIMRSLSWATDQYLIDRRSVTGWQPTDIDWQAIRNGLTVKHSYFGMWYFAYIYLYHFLWQNQCFFWALWMKTTLT